MLGLRLLEIVRWTWSAESRHARAGESAAKLSSQRWVFQSNTVCSGPSCCTVGPKVYPAAAGACWSATATQCDQKRETDSTGPGPHAHPSFGLRRADCTAPAAPMRRGPGALKRKRPRKCG